MSNPEPQVEMPRWQCHKKVHAVLIRDAKPSVLKPEVVTLLPDHRGMLPIEKPKEWCLKHNVSVPGYFVVYEDGYESWSPKEAFEKGYSRI